jgi:hypothetical protein
MTAFAVLAWDYAVERSLSLGGWEKDSLSCVVVRLSMTLGPMLLFRRRQHQHDDVFDYEGEV